MLGMPLRKSPSEKFISRIPIVGPLEELSFGQAFVMELLAEHAVLCQVTESHSNILKFTPPLVIDEEQCSDVATAVDATLRRLANGVSASIGSMRHLVRNLTQSRAAEAD